MSNSILKINDLPFIEEVKKISQGLALLDAIIMPEWEHRYFSFNCRWDEGGSEMLASMRDGSGGGYFLHFSENGAVGKVLDEQSIGHALTVLAQVPDSFFNFKTEPAFQVDDATFYFWQTAEKNEWFAAPDNLSSYACLGFLKDGSACYHKWAENYYEKSIDVKTMQEVFNSLSVSQYQLSILNAELSIEDLGKDIEEILGTPQ